MTRSVFADATPAQVDRLARTLIASHVFPDSDTLHATHRQRPWTIQVSDRGDVAVLDRWRDHLDLLAIEALWCPPRRVAGAIAHLASCAGEHGFSGLVSPPVSEDDVTAYESAGMRVKEMLVVLDRTLARPPEPLLDTGIVVRPAGESDASEVLAVDSSCFEPFWRYDLRSIRRFLGAGGITLAERDGRCVGYTLTTVDRESAVLGRLCVRASARRQGAGSRLLGAAVVQARDLGARRMTLSTRTGNRAALALYRSAGFSETGRRYAFLTYGDDVGRGGDHRIGSFMGG